MGLLRVWPWTMEASHSLSKPDFKALGSTETGWGPGWPHVSLRCHWGWGCNWSPRCWTWPCTPKFFIHRDWLQHPLACECHLYLGVLGQGLCLHIGPGTSALEDTTPELTGLRISFHSRIWGPSMGLPCESLLISAPSCSASLHCVVPESHVEEQPWPEQDKKDPYRIGAGQSLRQLQPSPMIKLSASTR